MMLMRIMYELKILTETIESSQLNVIDCKLIIENTVDILEHINKDTSEVDKKINSAKHFSENFGIDPKRKKWLPTPLPEHK